MSTVSIRAINIKKSFGRRAIFSNINFVLERRQSLTIIGSNGSGKTTLLKILANLLSPTDGKIEFSSDGKILSSENNFEHFGFVSPYLQMYDEFTAWENLDIVRKVRKLNLPDERLEALLDRFKLLERRDDAVRTYSSGMKQRLKYAFALLHQPPILILDEPSANLDDEGKKTVHQIVEEQKQDGIVIMATNEGDEINWCEQSISMDAQ